MVIVGRGVASAMLGDGQMEGRRRSALGRGACDGGVLPPPRSRLLSQHQQGSVGSSGGQWGPSLPLSAHGTVPDTRSLGEQEHRADLISLQLSGCAYTSACASRSLFPPFLIMILSV